jgi:hypothetical protein
VSFFFHIYKEKEKDKKRRKDMKAAACKLQTRGNYCSVWTSVHILMTLANVFTMLLTFVVVAMVTLLATK